MLEVKTKWRGLDEAFAELERECTAVVRGITVSAWKAVLRETPQWSGGLAASWTYCVNTPTFENRTHLAPKVPSVGVERGEGLPAAGPHKKGDFQAIAIANQASAGREFTFKLGDRVYFTNGAEHRDGFYADLVEQGMTPLRAVNQPGRMAGRAFDMLTSKYGGGIPARAAGQLKNLTIGSTT